MRTDREFREDYLKGLVEDLPIAVYEIDVAGRILYTNSAYAEITGYGVDKLVGMSVQDLMVPGPEKDRLPAILESLAAETPEPFVFSAENLKPDGAHIYIEVHWDYRRDAEGRVIGFACALKDTTKRVEMEHELRLLEERFRSMFEQSPFGTVVYRPNGRPLYVNPAQKALMGISEEEMALAMDHYNILEDQQLESQGLMPFIKEGFSGESVALPAILYEPRKMEPRLDHESIWLRGFIYPLRSETGEVREVVVNFEDITSAKKAEKLEERLQQAQKLESLAVLTGGVAHDFNNLLVAILGNADLALRELPPGSVVHKAANDITNAASSAAGLVQEMLAYSGESPIEKELLDLSTVVDEVSHLIEAAVSKKAIVHKEITQDNLFIEADRSQLRQIIMNLIINASEAMAQDDTSISITTRTGVVEVEAGDLTGNYIGEELPAGRYCFLEVSDTGVGMDEETKKRLFEPFFSTKFEGRGLGLASVLGIVRGHGGAITVDSTLGHGSTIRVLLPASSTVVKPDGIGKSPENWQGEGTVLFVEDNAVVSATGQHMLQHLGFEVVIADNGRRALDIVRNEPARFVCILMDIAMPEMDGVECMERLFEMGCDVPVLVSSGFGRREVASRLAGREPAGFLHKPFDLEALKEALYGAIT